MSGLTRLLLLLLIARQFGPGEFGRLALVLTVVEVFRVVADLGTDYVTIRRFSQDRVSSPDLMNNVLALKLLTATVAFGVSFPMYWLAFRDGAGLGLLAILGFSFYTSLCLNAVVSYFQATLSMRGILGASLVSVAVYAGVTLIGLYFGWPLAALVVAVPVSEFINLLLVLSKFRRESGSPVRLGFHRATIAKLVRESAPVAVGGIAVVLYSRMDNLLLGLYLGESAVGTYAVAFRLTEPVMLLVSSLSLSLYARLSELGGSGDQLEIRRTLRQALRGAILVSATSAVVLAAFGTWGLHRVFPAFIESGAILTVLACAVVFKSVNAQLSAYIASTGGYAIVTRIAIFNLGVNVSLNLWLIPILGGLGAAVSLALTEALNAVVQSSMARRVVGSKVPGARTAFPGGS